MNPAQAAAALSLGLFVAMVGCLEGGYRMARRRSGGCSEPGSPGVGAVEAAVFGLLVSLALLSGLLAGYAMGNRERRSWLHVVLYSAVVAITIYVVLDLDHPRSGLIRLDAADNALVKLRNSIR